METNTTSVIENNNNAGKQTAIISYITLIGWIIAFVQNGEKKNAFASYHIRQMLGLMCTGLALGVINIIPILGWIISILGTLFILVLWFVGLMNAINERTAPVPLLGKLYEKWFSNIQ